VLLNFTYPTQASVGSDGSDSDLEIVPTRRRILPTPRSASRSLPDPTQDPSIESQSTRQLSLGYDGADDDSSGQAINKRGTPLKNVSARNFLAGGSTYNAPIPNKSSPSVKASPGKLSKKPTKRGQTSNSVVLSDDDSNGQELALTTPRKTRSGIRKLGSEQYGSKEFSRSTKKLQEKRRNSNAIATGDEGDDDDRLPDILEIKTSSGNQRKPGAKVVDLMEIDEDDEDESMFVRPSRKRARATGVGGTDDDDEDPISPSLLKRRRAMSTDNEESDASASMARALQKEFDDEHQKKHLTRKQQPRKVVHRTAAQKKIELLRRKRAGEDISEVTSTESDEGDMARGLYDSTSDSERQALAEFDDEEKESGDDDIEKVRDSLQPGNSNRYDDEFIVDDDDEALGVPGHGLLDIPLRFTKQAHKPLKEHFKDAMDWMVQRKVIRPFSLISMAASRICRLTHP
jgi:hypothetical protein